MPFQFLLTTYTHAVSQFSQNFLDFMLLSCLKNFKFNHNWHVQAPTWLHIISLLLLLLLPCHVDTYTTHIHRKHYENSTYTQFWRVDFAFINLTVTTDFFYYFFFSFPKIWEEYLKEADENKKKKNIDRYIFECIYGK